MLWHSFGHAPMLHCVLQGDIVIVQWRANVYKVEVRLKPEMVLIYRFLLLFLVILSCEVISCLCLLIVARMGKFSVILFLSLCFKGTFSMVIKFRTLHCPRFSCFS